jgi:hypothetical protein
MVAAEQEESSELRSWKATIFLESKEILAGLLVQFRATAALSAVELATRRLISCENGNMEV